MKIFFLVVMLVGNLGDAISTYFAAKVIGIHKEKNPFCWRSMRDGVISGLIGKVLFFSSLGVLFYFTMPILNLIIGIPYYLVIYNNFRKVKAALKRRALDQKGGLG